MFWLSLLIACSSENTTTSEVEKTPEQPKTEAMPIPIEAPKPIQEPLVGEAQPSLLVTQAWFWKDASGDSQPGAARLDIWRYKEGTWSTVRVEDGDSNVFHKAIPYDGGIVTIGAEQAMLKKWTFADGKWNTELLWQRDWKGKFNRLRDMEVGDVDQDGKDELIIATHDAGVVAVYNPDAPADQRIVELDEQADMFVHEIEVGDINGDGKMEFFATPSERNQSKKSQAGKVVMYRWNGSTYTKTVVDEFFKTHAKEILVADINADKKSEFFAVLEAERVGKAIIKPVEIRQYTEQAEGGFTHSVAFTLQDEQCRFLVPGDFDHDGVIDIVAAGYTSGLWIARQNNGVWTTTLIDSDSSGFEHTAYATDMNKDGKLELVVAADNQASLNMYRWDATSTQFNKEKIGDLAPDSLTWNIVYGEF